MISYIIFLKFYLYIYIIMIYNLYMFALSGVGQIISLHTSKKLKEGMDILIGGFLSAMRGFSHELTEELKALLFVNSQMVILPSQNRYILVAHASYDNTNEELLHYLELIRDQINEKYWDEIHTDMFYINTSELNKKIEDIVLKITYNQKWVENANAKYS